MWWIYKKDQPSYEELMRNNGAEPKILQEAENKVQVVFTQSVLNTWTMMGKHIE